MIWTKNNKTCVFYVLYSDKTGVFDQSEGVKGPIYIIIHNNNNEFSHIALLLQNPAALEVYKIYKSTRYTWKLLFVAFPNSEPISKDCYHTNVCKYCFGAFILNLSACPIHFHSSGGSPSLVLVTIKA